MKKTNIILILIAMISLFGLGGVLVLFGDSSGQEPTKSTLESYQENYVTNVGMNKEIIVDVKENFSSTSLTGIYDIEFQKSVKEKIDSLIEENSYNEDKPLVIYNPFLTNTQSLYVYFETEEPYAVSYSIHTPEAEFGDFGGYVVPNQPDTSKVHEFQMVGLIPNETNMITFRMMDKNGTVKIRRFYYYNEHGVEIDTIELETTVGTKEVQNADKTWSTVPASEESVADGLFVTFPDKNEVLPYVRIYDNDGIQRGEIPLETFGPRKMIVYEDLMFYPVSEHKMVGINRFGQVVKVYESGTYTFGEDFCLDKNNDFLMIASDNRQDSINDCIIKDVLQNVSVLPSNVNLAAAEIELIGVERKEFILRNEVDYIKEQYDYILIDCPPSLSMLTVNAMTTATSVLVPIQCEYYALEGLSQLIHTIDLVQQRLNPNLSIEGIVFTMYDVRTNLSNQVVESVKNSLDTKIYDTMIPRNIRLAEAPSHGIPINMYDTRSAGAESYRNLAQEIIDRKDI